ncbi:UNVERIFIED_ORG: hypothetical protein HNP28_003331 [Comamonas terrigena]
METKRIKGVDPLAIDKKVLAAVKKNASPWDCGDRYRIAIRNSAGQIYRVVEMDSLGIYMGVEQSLDALGLRNQVAKNRPVDGFDSIYVLPDATPSSNA